MNAWIVLYTIRERNKDFEEVYNDYSEIFMEYDEGGQSPKYRANLFYKHMLSDPHNTNSLYSINLCEVKDSSEATYINVKNHIDGRKTRRKNRDKGSLGINRSSAGHLG